MTLHYFEQYLADSHRATMATQPLGEQPVFHEGVFIKDCHIGEWTEVGANSWLVETTMDDYSYTAGDNQIIYTQIGKFSNIASHVRINPGNHPMERVTLHHITYRRKMYGLGEDDPAFFEWRRSHKCVIGHDTWLGHNVVVMPGVSIGTGAVIGSGAVVTKDVEPYTIAVGVPAKPIRKRFPDVTIEKLLQIAWWDWDRATLKARFDDLYNIEQFVEKYG
jgi:phosphonate metabolism protein (transferase hexapeptide repeat family)